MLTYIDSHAHYDAEQFDPDRAELLQTLHKGGVRNIVNIGCTLERSQFSIDLAEKFQFIGEFLMLLDTITIYHPFVVTKPFQIIIEVDR